MNFARALGLLALWLGCVALWVVSLGRMVAAPVPLLDVALLLFSGAFTSGVASVLPLIVPRQGRPDRAAVTALVGVGLVTVHSAVLVWRQGDLIWAFLVGALTVPVVLLAGAVTQRYRALRGSTLYQEWWPVALFEYALRVVSLLGLLMLPATPTIGSASVLIYSLWTDPRPWNLAHFSTVLWAVSLWVTLWPWQSPRRFPSLIRAALTIVLSLTCLPMAVTEYREDDLRPALIIVFGTGVILSMGVLSLFDRLDPPER